MNEWLVCCRLSASGGFSLMLGHAHHRPRVWCSTTTLADSHGWNSPNWEFCHINKRLGRTLSISPGCRSREQACSVRSTCVPLQWTVREREPAPGQLILAYQLINSPQTAPTQNERPAEPFRGHLVDWWRLLPLHLGVSWRRTPR